MTLRDVRVRKLIHELDRSKSSYPTVARTGDINRRGKFQKVFDDTRTVVFKNSVPVSYPTLLPTSSPYLASDLSSSIVVQGNVVPNAVDAWIPRLYEGEPYTGFKEENLFEQLRTVASSSFYQTGTAVSDVGEGFTSTLGNKTAIRFELPITGTTFLNPLSASSYYYDFRTRKFELVHVNAFGPTMGSSDTSLGAGATARPPLARENLFFNALGKHTTNLRSTGQFVTTAPAAFPDFYFNSEVSGDNFRVSSTTPAVSQTLSLENYINQPFLLEKCVIKIPVTIGQGWLKDKTHIPLVETDPISLNFNFDIGGPAITFAMFNSLQNHQKDLILSATIIPERDNTREITRQNVGKNAYSFPYDFRYFPQGFRSFSLPSCVVKETGGSITGSLTIEIEPYVSIGATTMESFAPANYNPAQIPFVQQTVGRGKNNQLNDLTGRSIFGRQTLMPGLPTVTTQSVAGDTINHDLLIASTSLMAAAGKYWGQASNASGNERFFQRESHTRSPYLILPKDKLFFSLNKWRSAFVSSSYSTIDSTYITKGLPPPTHDGLSVWMYQSASHDFSINSGTFSVTLYGSLIKEGKEYHDPVNARLDTEQVHEAIGMDPITDEFDVFYNSELTGTYIDRFRLSTAVPYLKGGSAFAITGTSTFVERVHSHRLQNIDYSAGIVRTLANQSWSSQFFYTQARSLEEIRKGTARNVNFASNELFWDCRLPDPGEISRFKNPSVRLAGFDAGDGLTYYNTLYTGDTTVLGSLPNVGINDWIMTFPYEPKYGSISTKFFNSLKGDIWNYKLPGFPAAGTDKFVMYESINIEVGPSTARIVGGEYVDSFFGIMGLGLSEFVKVFYGFGKGRSTWDNGHVTFRVNRLGNGNNWYGANLRGWRYGLMSGFPLCTIAVFRRDRFGQMRDMLEQRLDGKFYNDGELGPVQGPLEAPVKVRFVNSSGETVQPYETFSSNLSTEVTSSIPYFDGDVRNRENPITFATANQSVVIIS